MERWKSLGRVELALEPLVPSEPATLSCVLAASGKVRPSKPELGAPLAVPQLFELAIYCDFADAPNLEVCGNDDVFQHKLRSIEAYRSQLQIASLVESIRQDGPYEYLRDVHFRLYSSKKYRPLFAD